MVANAAPPPGAASSRAETAGPVDGAPEAALPACDAPPAAARTDPSVEVSPLPRYTSLFERNPDLFGWISIEDTGVDYPVMYTPDRPGYYLDRAFDGSFSYSGVPFLEEKCPADGNYFLIYGHHMQNRTMFGTLLQYAERSYWEAHPLIRFDTRCEQRVYQVIAAFYSRVYDPEERDVFRYYEYADLTDEAVFAEYVRQVRAAAIYDTGLEARYGDELLTLSTCSYHTADGRFAVVARRIDEGC